VHSVSLFAEEVVLSQYEAIFHYKNVAYAYCQSEIYMQNSQTKRSRKSATSLKNRNSTAQANTIRAFFRRRCKLDMQVRFGWT